jgi:hypothetical protein
MGSMLIVVAAILLCFGHYGWAAMVIVLFLARLAIIRAAEGL